MEPKETARTAVTGITSAYRFLGLRRPFDRFLVTALVLWGAVHWAAPNALYVYDAKARDYKQRDWCATACGKTSATSEACTTCTWVPTFWGILGLAALSTGF